MMKRLASAVEKFVPNECITKQAVIVEEDKDEAFINGPAADVWSAGVVLFELVSVHQNRLPTDCPNCVSRAHTALMRPP